MLAIIIMGVISSFTVPFDGYIDVRNSYAPDSNHQSILTSFNVFVLYRPSAYSLSVLIFH